MMYQLLPGPRRRSKNPFLLLALLLALLLLSGSGSEPNTDCPHKPTAAQSDLDVYWINLESSLDRREVLSKHLASHALKAHRVPALTPQDIHIPREIAVPDECRILASLSSTALKSDTGRTAEQEAQLLVTSAPPLSPPPANQGSSGGTAFNPANIKVIVDAHCGRPKNSKREFTVTASHLKALYTATRGANNSSPTPTSIAAGSSPYALILEDDLLLPFVVDFDRLIASAPKDWVMLQLVTSNERDVNVLYNKFKKSSGALLWHKRLDKNDFWCAGAYIVHKQRLRVTIDRIVRRLEKTPGIGNGAGARGKKEPAGQTETPLVMTVLAGYSRPCFPRVCCSDDARAMQHETAMHALEHGYEHVGRFVVGGTVWDAPVTTSGSSTGASNAAQVAGTGTGTGTGTHPACIFAARGYQADHYIFSLARRNTYMLTVPIIAGAGVGNRSTLHQDHVNMLHVGAFKRIEAIQEEVREGIRKDAYKHKGLLSLCNTPSAAASA